MNKIILIISLIVLALIVSSCGKSIEKTQAEEKQVISDKEVNDIESELNDINDLDIWLDDKELTQLESDLDI